MRIGKVSLSGILEVCPDVSRLPRVTETGISRVGGIDGSGSPPPLKMAFYIYSGGGDPRGKPERSRH